METENLCRISDKNITIIQAINGYLNHMKRGGKMSQFITCIQNIYNVELKCDFRLNMQHR